MPPPIVRLWHTGNGILMGTEKGGATIHSRHGVMVENPVIVVVNGEGANLMAIYSLTEETEYFVPDDTLIYGKSMTPSPRLMETYLSKYVRVDDETSALGIGLTTYPA